MKQNHSFCGVLIFLLLAVSADAQSGNHRYINALKSCTGSGCPGICRATNAEPVVICGVNGPVIAFSELGTCADFECTIEADGYSCETPGCIGSAEIADAYLLNTGDTSTGTLAVDTLSGAISLTGSTITITDENPIGGEIARIDFEQFDGDTFAVGVTGTADQWVVGSDGDEALRIAFSAPDALEIGVALVTLNPGGVDYDTVIEGDAEPNLVYVDASADRVGIGTATPGARLDIEDDGPRIRFSNTGTGGGSFEIFVNSGGRFTFRDSAGGTNPVKIEPGSNTNLLRIGLDSGNVAAADTVSLGESSTPAMLEVYGLIVQVTAAGTITAHGLLASAPGACSIGDTYADSSGANCFCSAANTWEAQGVTGSCV